MCKVNDKVGWAPPSYLKKVDKGESGESDSDDEYLGLPGGEFRTLRNTSRELNLESNIHMDRSYTHRDILAGYHLWLLDINMFEFAQQ
jgi:hypothetical protein